MKRSRTNIDGRKRMKLPSAVQDLFASKSHDDDNNDSKLYECRFRSQPHVVGNYPTHIHIPVELTAELQEVIDDVIHTLSEKKGLSSISFHPTGCNDIHISLSRQLYLRHHIIHPFIQAFSSNLELAKAQPLRAFPASLSSFRFYRNDERTRFFVGLTICEGIDTILTLIEAVDKTCKQFGLPSYYEDPTPHLSILWTLEPLDVLIKESELSDGDLEPTQHGWEQENDCMLYEFNVGIVIVSVGDKIYHFPLRGEGK